MVLADVPRVHQALNKHLRDSYKVHISFTEKEIAHFFVPREGVIYAYLAEDSHGKVTDFISFYELNSSILGHDVHKTLRAAYSYYTFVEGNDAARFKQVIKDALILAKQHKFDVFNLTEVM